MRKPRTKQVAQVIEEVKATRNWELLEHLKNISLSEEITGQEKQSLSLLFFEQGKEILENSVDLVELDKAFNSLDMAVKLDPAHGKAWIAWAEIHMKIGLIKEDLTLLEKADSIFIHADSLLLIQQTSPPLDVLWNWGTCLYYIAKKTEEPIDYKKSIEKFRLAHEKGLTESSFLLAYGTVLGELGVLIGREELIEESTGLLEKSLQEDGEASQGWVRLACSYKVLFFINGKKELYEKADESFFNAARLDTENVSLWLNWGQLVLLEANNNRDLELLRFALEKIEKADQLKPQDSLIMSTKADALIHIGMIEESLESFKEAQDLLEKALKISPNQIEIINLLGHCLVAIGKYFDEASFIEKAIERFEHGLSANKNFFPLWHGLANAHYALGEMNTSPNDYEKAAHFTSQAIKLGANAPGFWNNWGISLMRMGELTHKPEYYKAAIEKFEEAINSYQRGHQQHPDPDWFFNYGCALDSLGILEGNLQYFERAISVLSRLLEQCSTSFSVRYHLALALYHLGDFVIDVEILERAIEHFNELAKLEPEDDELFHDKGLAYLTMGEFLIDEVHPEKAEDCFKKAEQSLCHAIALGSEEANYSLACLYSIQENYTEAMHYIERAYQADVLPPLEELLRETWLEGLRQTHRFRSFLAFLSEE